MSGLFSVSKLRKAQVSKCKWIRCLLSKIADGDGNEDEQFAVMAHFYNFAPMDVG